MNRDDLKTERLDLVGNESRFVEAFFVGRERLGQVLRAKVAPNFPVFGESMTYWRTLGAPTPESFGYWRHFLWVLRDERVVIGDGGFKAPPDDEGRVEIGYAVLAEYRGRGFATEAARAFVARAFSSPRIKAVVAHTLEDGYESIGVLKKLGFESRGRVRDPDEGTVLAWELNRNV